MTHKTSYKKIRLNSVNPFIYNQSKHFHCGSFLTQVNHVAFSNHILCGLFMTLIVGHI